MNRILLLLVSFMLLGQCNQSVDDSQKQKIVLGLFDQFQMDLSKELSTSMKRTGPLGSISNCKLISPAKEKDYLDTHSIRIRRVSEKYRNPDHKPDEWESIVLQKWAKELKEGKEISVSFTKTSEGFRVMRPIKINNSLCLQCHGKSNDMDPELISQLKELYPEDRALEYEMNQLRGAFSAIWPDKVPISK